MAALARGAAWIGGRRLAQARPQAVRNTTVTYAEALEEALRFGWIDAQKAPHDDAFWLQRFMPRGPRSKWSQINRQKATELIEQGRMTAAGLAQVEAARQDGRWENAYASPRNATVPEDFQRALDRTPPRTSSSPHWEAPTATASCTGSRTPSGRRRASAGSGSTWRCWPRAGRSTAEATPREPRPAALHKCQLTSGGRTVASRARRCMRCQGPRDTARVASYAGRERGIGAVAAIRRLATNNPTPNV